MKTYMFDCKLFATVTLKAESEAEAVATIKDALGYTSINAGAWPDGSPILCETSLMAEPDLVEIEGHPV